MIFFGTAAGTMLLVASSFDLNTESGIDTAFGGIAGWLSAGFVGAPMLASASQDNDRLVERAAVFAAMTAGIHQKDASFYQMNKAAVKGSGNTPVPCFPQKASALNLIIRKSH